MKVSCLGPVGETRIDGASEALDTAEGEKTAEEVAAAASEETVRPEPKASIMYQFPRLQSLSGNIIEVLPYLILIE